MADLFSIESVMTMRNNTMRSFKVLSIARKVLPFIFIAVLIWVAHFWHSASFGLYEDDYNMVSRGMAMSGQELWKTISAVFMRFEGGKPFHASFVYFLSFLGSKLGGLNVLYWIGYLLVTLNAFLFYMLLKRVTTNSFSFLGAIAYALFSADTNQAFLTHALGFQPSLSFLLLAIHCYISERRFLSYLFASLTLFTYEVTFPVFFAAPLLARKWNKQTLKILIGHGLVLSSILAIFVLFRYAIGETRVSNLSFPEIITVPVIHMIQGPFMSVRSYIHRPYQALRALNSSLALMIVTAIPVFMLVLRRVEIEWEINNGVATFIRKAYREGLVDSIRNSFAPLQLPKRLIDVIKLGISGLVMLILAYPLTFTVSPLSVYGRNTRVHFVAIIGATIICACICWLIINLAGSVTLKWIATFVVAVFFSLMLVFGFVVQEDYRRAWDLQREFWSDVIPLIPDTEEGTVVLVDPSQLQDTLYIGANFWNLPRVLDQIYRYPSEWVEPPKVFRLVPDWQKHIIAEGGQFQLNAATTFAPPSTFKDVHNSNVVLIETSTGQPARRTEPLVLDGVEYPLKKMVTIDLPRFKHGYLFDFLIQVSD
jgi:hypothetical protein